MLSAESATDQTRAAEKPQKQISQLGRADGDCGICMGSLGECF